MIQNTRSSRSDSLLREAEEAILLFRDSNIEQFFRSSINRVVQKRNDPEITYTGAKHTRENLLAYLEQQGEVKTANIWARNLKFDRDLINELKDVIKQELMAANIEGIVEIHLQDREINSPHLQFVGNNAKKAEEIIANILIRNNYEDSLESALGINKRAAYLDLEPKELPRKRLLESKIEQVAEDKQKTQEAMEKELRVKEMFKEINNRMKSFRELLNSFAPKEHTITSKKSRFEQIREIKSISTEDLRESYNRRRRKR